LKGDEKTLKDHKITNNAKLMLAGAALKEVMAVVTAQETSKEMDDPSQMKVRYSMMKCIEKVVVLKFLGF
jgi:hypothetical protein